jgi:hypothetical protein
MKVQEKKTVEYVLTLTAKEVFMLKGLVQNPPNDDDDVVGFCGFLFSSLPTFEELDRLMIEENK